MMNKIVKSVFLVVFAFIFLIQASPFFSAGCMAAENDDLRFAQRLQRDGMFIAAAEEYLRFSEKYPDSALCPLALFNAGESWMRANRADNALDALSMMLASYPGDENSCRARFYRGDIMRVMKKYREAADELMLIEEAFPECPLKEQALLLAGECRISAGDNHGAASVLRRLVDSGSDEALKPRAMFGLAMALANISRDLEADRVLEDLASSYGDSPVSALAFLRLGERAVDRGETGKAEEYFRKVLSSYKEDNLREKALARLIDVREISGDDSSVLEESVRFLKDFLDSEQRPGIYRKAVDSAWRLKRHDRALTLMSDWAAEGSMADSTGELTLLKGRILADRGRMGEALDVLKEFRYGWPRSPQMVEGLLLEAGLLREAGQPQAAAGRLHLALIEEGDPTIRTGIVSMLADVSARGLSDTLSAIRYWEMAAKLDDTGTVAAAALWNAGSAREAAGDAKGARSRFMELARRFPESEFAGRAGTRLKKMDLMSNPDDSAITEIAAYALADYPQEVKAVQMGILLLEKADRPEEAVGFLNRGLKDDLSDVLAAKARFYLGMAHYRLFELSSVDGSPDNGEKKKALSEWLEVARNHSGAEYGGRAHREYLCYKLEEWKLADRLKKIDEFLGYYGDSEHKWWARGAKGGYLYEAASGGNAWAVDSALTVLEMTDSEESPTDIRKEAVLRMGYLYRLKGDSEKAAGYFRRFIAAYGEDERSAPVSYDLGEALISIKDYRGALSAYRECMKKRPSRSTAAKCALRIGDMKYYLRDFSGAAIEYRNFSAVFPESNLVDETAYREALALERLGEFGHCDSILTTLEKSEDLPEGLRIRLLSRLAIRLKTTGRAAEAKVFLEELVKLERRHEHLVLYGEVLLETGDLSQAERVFSDAIRFDGVDSCRVTGGRAKARFMRGEAGKASEDLQMLLERKPDCALIAGILLEKGRYEAGKSSYDEAEITFSILRERFAGTGEASEALYDMAVCDMKRGGYDRAIERLNTMLREVPYSSIADQAYFKLASAYYGAGTLNLAAVNYGLAAEASKDDETVFLALKNMAMIYQELEDWERAAEGWYRVCERFPGRDDIVELFFNLGFSYGQSGSFEMAREVYSRIPGIARTEEQQGRAHYWAGISLKNLGRFAEAVREFLRVPYLRTGGMWGVTAKLEAAICYERNGQTEQAIQIYERIISSHGQNSDWGSLAKKALDRINGVEANDAGAGESGTGQEDSEGSSGNGDM